MVLSCLGRTGSLHSKVRTPAATTASPARNAGKKRMFPSGFRSYGPGRRKDSAIRTLVAETLVLAKTHGCVEKIESELEEELRRESRGQDSDPLSKWRRKGDQALKSKYVLLTVALFCVTDCALVLGELILDLHKVKDTLETSARLMEGFKKGLVDKYGEGTIPEKMDIKEVFARISSATILWDAASNCTSSSPYSSDATTSSSNSSLSPFFSLSSSTLSSASSLSSTASFAPSPVVQYSEKNLLARSKDGGERIGRPVPAGDRRRAASATSVAAWNKRKKKRRKRKKRSVAAVSAGLATDEAHREVVLEVEVKAHSFASHDLHGPLSSYVAFLVGADAGARSGATMESGVTMESGADSGGTDGPKEHSLEEEIAHALHLVSVTFMAILVFETLLKMFCAGLSFFTRKLETFDFFIVIVSFVVDVTFIKILPSYSIPDFVYILAFLLPWRVIRVVNSLVVAVQDHEHFRLKMMYSRKKKIQNSLRETEVKLQLFRAQCVALKRLCLAEGVEESKIEEIVQLDEYVVNRTGKSKCKVKIDNASVILLDKSDFPRLSPRPSLANLWGGGDKRPRGILHLSSDPGPGSACSSPVAPSGSAALTAKERCERLFGFGGGGVSSRRSNDHTLSVDDALLRGCGSVPSSPHPALGRRSRKSSFSFVNGPLGSLFGGSRSELQVVPEHVPGGGKVRRAGSQGQLAEAIKRDFVADSSQDMARLRRAGSHHALNLHTHGSTVMADATTSTSHAEVSWASLTGLAGNDVTKTAAVREGSGAGSNLTSFVPDLVSCADRDRLSLTSDPEDLKAGDDRVAVGDNNNVVAATAMPMLQNGSAAVLGAGTSLRSSDTANMPSKPVVRSAAPGATLAGTDPRDAYSAALITPVYSETSSAGHALLDLSDSSDAVCDAVVSLTSADSRTSARSQGLQVFDLSSLNAAAAAAAFDSSYSNFPSTPAQIVAEVEILPVPSDALGDGYLNYLTQSHTDTSPTPGEVSTGDIFSADCDSVVEQAGYSLRPLHGRPPDPEGKPDQENAPDVFDTTDIMHVSPQNDAVVGGNNCRVASTPASTLTSAVETSVNNRHSETVDSAWITPTSVSGTAPIREAAPRVCWPSSLDVTAPMAPVVVRIMMTPALNVTSPGGSVTTPGGTAATLPAETASVTSTERLPGTLASGESTMADALSRVLGASPDECNGVLVSKVTGHKR